MGWGGGVGGGGEGSQDKAMPRHLTYGPLVNLSERERGMSLPPSPLRQKKYK